MNYKALAAGAVLGFLMAVAPACGDSEDECGPNNCAGCCTADGVCTETAAQTVTACGASGNACVACAANQTCVGGACVVTTQPKPDAGTDAGSTCAQTCNGCCTNPPAGGTPICLPGNGATNCGSAGATCQQCTTAQTCGVPQGGTGNSCHTPVVVVSPIGKECTDAAACSEVGTGAECRTQTQDGQHQYPGGYCTKACQENVDCGDGGFCGPIGFPGQAADGGFFPVYETGNTCIGRCTPASGTTPASGCRTGYECVPLQGGSGVCILDLNTPDGQTGMPCTHWTECAFPPNNGFCWEETQEDGGLTGFTDGYCTADCTGKPQGYCGAGSTCVSLGSWSGCLTSCTAPGTRGDCRTGYTCYGLQSGSTDGVCFLACDAPGNGCDTGQTCDTTTGFCLLPDGGQP